jgi:hypothetical protein
MKLQGLIAGALALRLRAAISPILRRVVAPRRNVLARSLVRGSRRRWRRDPLVRPHARRRNCFRGGVGLFPLRHAGVVLGWRAIIVPRFRHDRLTLGSAVVGLRLR